MLFFPIIVVFFVSLYIVSKRASKKNFTPYQSALSFGLFNFGILLLVIFALLIVLDTISSGGDNSGAIGLVFLFPIAGLATLVEMFIVFFIFKLGVVDTAPDSGVSVTPKNDRVAMGVTAAPKNDRGAKIILILIAAFFVYIILSIFIGEYYEKIEGRKRTEENYRRARIENVLVNPKYPAHIILFVGQSAVDISNGVTLKLVSVGTNSSGDRFANVTIASSNSEPRSYTSVEGQFFAASGNSPDQFLSPGSPTGNIIIQLTSVSISSNNVNLKIRSGQ